MISKETLRRLEDNDWMWRQRVAEELPLIQVDLEVQIGTDEDLECLEELLRLTKRQAG